MQDEHPVPTAADLAVFARFADAFESAEFEAGRVHPTQQTGPDTFTFGWWESSPIVSEWHSALYDHNIIDPGSEYLSEEFAEKMAQFAADPSLLSKQDLSTIRTVLTNISRGDRFCEGYMAGMFENGVAQAATRRLAAL